MIAGLEKNKQKMSLVHLLKYSSKEMIGEYKKHRMSTWRHAQWPYLKQMRIRYIIVMDYNPQNKINVDGSTLI